MQLKVINSGSSGNGYALISEAGEILLLECGVKGSPSGPIYPPCCEGLDEEDFDLESYLKDVEDGEI